MGITKLINMFANITNLETFFSRLLWLIGKSKDSRNYSLYITDGQMSHSVALIRFFLHLM